MNNTNLNDYFLTHLPQTLSRFPEADLKGCMHWTQIHSKIWAMDSLYQIKEIKPQLIYVLAGWYGVLASLMLESDLFKTSTFRSFDIDPSCAKIAESLNQKWLINDWQFKATTADITQLSYETCQYETLKANGDAVRLIEEPDLLINTSCEHIYDFEAWVSKLPKGINVLFQSNNQISGEGHISCYPSLSDFQKSLNLSKVFYSGELDLSTYKRFMVIGQV